MTSHPRLPQADYLSVAIRTYADHGAHKLGNQPSHIPSKYSLVFDCETTTDATQALRFGCFQLRENKMLVEHGLFYDPIGMAEEEINGLVAYAHGHDHTLLTVNQFIDDYIYGYGYRLGTAIIGFNLPFDITRLAKEWGVARKSSKGGFSVRLSTDKRLPNITIKHVSSRMALIRFVRPYTQITGRGMRKRGLKRPPENGMFIDVRTLAAALLSGSYALGPLSKHLQVKNPKIATDNHGGPLTVPYLEYAVRDVQTTWECFEKLEAQYAKLGLATPIHKIMSEASVGKAYLSAMGIKPWREVQPDFPPDMLGKIMSTYYGGRSEVRIRRKIARAAYCDFLSMYPTVCTKMGLWGFVTAQGITWRDGTVEIREFLEKVSAEDFCNPATWKKMTAIVRMRPDAELLPVRAEYVRDAGTSIGLNYLTSSKPLYYTLAECITAKILTEKTPQIEEAIVFEAGPRQSGLKPVNIGGLEEYRVDPTIQDFYKTLIEQRQEIKGSLKKAPAGKRVQLDAAQLVLKIVANATSYGIFVEINVRNERKRQPVTCYGPEGRFIDATTKIEQPGRYFHPLLATLITGAARLLLALLECRVKDSGLDWALCDTDSMGIARPEGMTEAEFLPKVLGICQWFDGLNPYKHGGPLLKIEDDNYALGSGSKIQELFCLAVSAKRYALFNLVDGQPVIRKVSSHGLGHLLEPYDHTNPAKNIPPPKVELKEARLWHYDFWFQIITAELSGHGAEVDLIWHRALDQPAMSQYRASSPELLGWFKAYNEGKDYRNAVKPFNFLLTQIAHPGIGHNSTKSVSPYYRDRTKALDNVFDRVSKRPVSASRLQTYKGALAQYHLHPEAKFHNANFIDVGTTIRRHVTALGIRHIGKEFDRWEEAMHSCTDDTEIEYNFKMPDPQQFLTRLQSEAAGESLRRIARHAGLSNKHVSNILKGKTVPTSRSAHNIANAVKMAKTEHERELQNTKGATTLLRDFVARVGLRATARIKRMDPSNLRKKLK